MDNDEAIRRYADYLRRSKRGAALRTLRNNRYTLARLGRWLEVKCEVTLLQASGEDLDGWQSDQRVSHNTLSTYTSRVCGFYKWAAGDGGLLDEDPTDKLPRPTLRRGKPRPIPDADLEFALTIAAYNDPMVYAWLVLAAFAGLRACEVAGLRRTDVHRRGNRYYLEVTGKGGKQRAVWVSNEVVEALTPWTTTKLTGPMFRGKRGPLTAESIDFRANQFLHELGIAATFHMLRHWFGTELLKESGGDLRLVQEAMGHVSPETTALYTEVADDRSWDAADRLGSRLNAKKGGSRKNGTRPTKQGPSAQPKKRGPRRG